jgi:hypothetical protein
MPQIVVLQRGIELHVAGDELIPASWEGSGVTILQSTINGNPVLVRREQVVFVELLTPEDYKKRTEDAALLRAQREGRISVKPKLLIPTDKQ